MPRQSNLASLMPPRAVASPCKGRMVNELGEHCTYRAVSEENAMKRVNKEFPDHTWECDKIYSYA